MWKYPLAYLDINHQICLSLRLVVMNFCYTSFSASDSGYTLQSIDIGVSSLRSMAWSQGCYSGNCSKASSKNTWPNLWYCLGTSSCQVCYVLSVAFSTSCWATVVFLTVKAAAVALVVQSVDMVKTDWVTSIAWMWVKGMQSRPSKHNKASEVAAVQLQLH
jgi:hypothetical protein